MRETEEEKGTEKLKETRKERMRKWFEKRGEENRGERTQEG